MKIADARMRRLSYFIRGGALECRAVRFKVPHTIRRRGIKA
jgi:hypothetical protein